jgi:hypothetical protein
MLVPHSSRPIVNLRFSWYLVATLVGLLALLFTVNLVFLLNRTVSAQGFKSLQARYDSLSRERRDV